MVAQTSTDLSTGRPCFAAPLGELSGYLAHPAGPEKHPAVLIIHENTGLNAHIEDMVRRFAGEGFLAFALDALALQGGTPANEDQARSLISNLDEADNRANYLAALEYLRNHPASTGKAGSVGFCWGGKVSGELAVADPSLDAAVIYYGKSPDPKQVPNIDAPLLLHYGEQDERINATVPGFKKALEEHGKRFSLHMHKGAGHAFNNDTRPDRYEPNAAAQAWRHTVDFLKGELDQRGK